MFGLGFTEIIILLAVSALAVYPMWRIARRLGYSSGVSVIWGIALVFLALPASWILAFVTWPRDEASETRATSIE